MNRLNLLLLSGVVVLAIHAPAQAQDADFSLTYHVERTPAGQLSIDTCANVVAETAKQAGLRADLQSYPGQLVVVTGGVKSSGAFVVQYIAVDDKTVSVVQGIDYRQQKGALDQFADQAFQALKDAVNNWPAQLV